MLLKELGWMRIFTAFQFLFLLSLCVCVGFLGVGGVCAFVSWWAVEIWVHSVSSLSPHAGKCIMPSARLYHKVCNRQNSFI